MLTPFCKQYNSTMKYLDNFLDLALKATELLCQQRGHLWVLSVHNGLLVGRPAGAAWLQVHNMVKTIQMLLLELAELSHHFDLQLCLC